MKHIYFSIIVLSLLVFYTGCKKNCSVSPDASLKVNATNSLRIAAVGDSVILTGSSTAANASYLWRAVEGPSIPTIGNDTALVTYATHFAVAGNYVFQLQATNTAGVVGLDTTNIIVAKTLTAYTVGGSGQERNFSELDDTDYSSSGTSELLAMAWTGGGYPYFNIDF